MYPEPSDNKNVFFYESDDGHFVPRALLLDLEPRVLHSMRNKRYGRIFSDESFWMSVSGGGAGNIWASGYRQAEEAQETLFDLLDREVESCGNLEGFFLCHSIAGGTGSGMGSFLLELINDRYPKKISQTFSVFPGGPSSSTADNPGGNGSDIPSNHHNRNHSHNHNNTYSGGNGCGAAYIPAESTGSDVVVQPYNSILTLKRLALHADAVVVLENSSLNRLAVETLRLSRPSFSEINFMVATAIANQTAGMRFPSYMNNSLISLLAPLIPTPRTHFLIPSVAPLEANFTTSTHTHTATNPGKSGHFNANVNANANLDAGSDSAGAVSKAGGGYIKRTSASELLRRLLNPRNFMASAPKVSPDDLLSLYVGIRGPVEHTEIKDALSRLHNENILGYGSSNASHYPTQSTYPSSYGVPLPGAVSGGMLRWKPKSLQLAVSTHSPHHRTANRLSGLLLANARPVASLFETASKQFNTLYKRRAFIENFRREPLFRDNLEEFDDAYETVQIITQEYREMS